MSLKTATLYTGASYTTTVPEPATGIAFKQDGQVIANGIHLVAVNDVENYATRRQITAKVRPAMIDSKTGIYNKDKKSLTFVIPSVIDGKTVFNTVRVEMEIHPLAENTVLPQLKGIGSQMLTSSYAVDFWLLGTFD